MTAIKLKTDAELAKMRNSGQLLARVFKMLDEFVCEGVTTMEINDRVESFIINDLHSRPASKGQYDYPYSLNTSLNEVVCHGMPKASQKLRSGTIVNLDITLENGGYIADSSKMYMIGEVSPLAKRLVEKTYEAMWCGIRAVKPGATLGDIGAAIQQHAKANAQRHTKHKEQKFFEQGKTQNIGQRHAAVNNLAFNLSGSHARVVRTPSWVKINNDIVDIFKHPHICGADQGFDGFIPFFIAHAVWNKGVPGEFSLWRYLTHGGISSF